MSDRTNKLLNPLLKDTTIRATLRKLVEPLDAVPNGERSTIGAPDELALRSISDNTTANIMDAKSIFQLLPDVELSANILVGSILAPKDMINVHLNFGVAMGALDPETAAPLLAVVAGHFTKDYKIESRLEEMLMDILFHRGSYPLAVIPEGAVDLLINGSNTVSKESLLGEFGANGFLAPKGILGSSGVSQAASTTKESLESLLTDHPLPTINTAITFSEDFTLSIPGAEKSIKFAKEDFSNIVTVVDNIDTLRVPKLLQAVSENRLRSKMGLRDYGMEAKQEQLSPEEMRKVENELYLRRNFKHVTAAALPLKSVNAKGADEGHPLVLDLPSEAVIPVHVPSYPKKHIGYFILLDINGNPIANATRTDHYAEISSRLMMRREVTQAAMGGQSTPENVFSSSAGRYELDNMARTYARAVEADLLTRLKNGIYTGEMSISAPEEVYRVMLARTLAKQHTQLLYVPKDYMVYMALDYNEYGIGRSLIEKTKIISSLRATLMFANTMGAVKNSVGRTNVVINLDEKDTNPIETVERLLHSYVNGNAARFPIGTSSAKDLMNYLQRAGVGVQVSGNQRYPQTSMSVEDKSSQRVQVDTTLMDDLKKQQAMAFGLSPDMVDTTLNVEYATSIVQSHLMLAKTTSLYGKVFCDFLLDFFVKYVQSSSILMDALADAIKDNKLKLPKQVKEAFDDARSSTKEKKDAAKKSKSKDADDKDDKSTSSYTDDQIRYFIYYFLDNMTVSLPKADNASMEVKVNALEVYIKGIDAMLDAILSTGIYTDDTDGAVAGKIDQYREIVKAGMIKMWAIDNDFMPEMFNLLETDKDGNQLLDLVKTQGESMSTMSDLIIDFIIFADKQKKIHDKRLQKAGILDAPEEDTTGDDTDAGGDDAGDGLDAGAGDGGVADDGTTDDDSGVPGLDDTATDDDNADAGDDVPDLPKI